MSADLLHFGPLVAAHQGLRRGGILLAETLHDTAMAIAMTDGHDVRATDKADMADMGHPGGGLRVQIIVSKFVFKINICASPPGRCRNLLARGVRGEGGGESTSRLCL